jgi:hypothetical protein
METFEGFTIPERVKAAAKPIPAAMSAAANDASTRYFCAAADANAIAARIHVDCHGRDPSLITSDGSAGEAQMATTANAVVMKVATYA